MGRESIYTGKHIGLMERGGWVVKIAVRESLGIFHFNISGINPALIS